MIIVHPLAARVSKPVAAYGGRFFGSKTSSHWSNKKIPICFTAAKKSTVCEAINDGATIANETDEELSGRSEAMKPQLIVRLFAGDRLVRESADLTLWAPVLDKVVANENSG